MSAREAARLLADGSQWDAEVVATDPVVRARAYRELVRQHHPDRGGDAELFARLTQARDTLDAAAGVL